MKLLIPLLAAIAIGFAATAPASADSHTNGDDTTATAPGIPGPDGWIVIGTGTFTSEIRQANVGEIIADGTGAQIEVGLRANHPKRPRTGVWFSLIHLTVDYGEITVRGRPFDIDANGDATLLSVGFDGFPFLNTPWIPYVDTPWRPYVGIFVGTDSNAGFHMGLSYRFENNLELGGKVMVGREDADIPGFRHIIWSAFGVTAGYGF